MTTEYNYLQDNHKAFSLMLTEIIEAYPVGSWANKETRDGFKQELLSDYVSFLYNLNYLPIQPGNDLYKQHEFSKKLFLMCDRYKMGGLDNAVPTNKLEMFIHLLKDHIGEYVYSRLDTELKKQEKEFYTAAAFNKDNTKVLSSRIDQLKTDATRNTKFKLRF